MGLFTNSLKAVVMTAVKPMAMAKPRFVWALCKPRIRGALLETAGALVILVIQMVNSAKKDMNGQALEIIGYVMLQRKNGKMKRNNTNIVTFCQWPPNNVNYQLC